MILNVKSTRAAALLSRVGAQPLPYKWKHSTIQAPRALLSSPGSLAHSEVQGTGPSSRALRWQKEALRVHSDSSGRWAGKHLPWANSEGREQGMPQRSARGQQQGELGLGVGNSPRFKARAVGLTSQTL